MSKPKRRRRTAQDTRDEVFGKLVPVWVRDEIHARLGELLKATLDAAIGVRVVFAKDATTGQWAQVTDPATLEALFEHPNDASAWTIYTQAPDRALLASVLAWQIGPPFTAPHSPNLMDVLVVDPHTEESIPVRERLVQLRTGPPGPAPQVTEPLEDDDPTGVH